MYRILTEAIMTQVIQVLQWNQVIKTDLFFLSDLSAVLGSVSPCCQRMSNQKALLSIFS